MSTLSIWEELNNSDDENEENNDVEYTDEDDWEYDYPDPPSEEDLRFEKELRELLQEIVDSEVVTITEEFMTDRKAKDHFESHCLGHDRKSRISTRQNVYYDFKDVSLYKERERSISSDAEDRGSKNVYTFNCLLDREDISKALRKLFEGGIYIRFTYDCGLRNEKGPISLLVHSFASDVTKNYLRGNTIDILIRADRKTLTMYPVDANYFENKFNNILKKHYPSEIERFKINH